MMTYNPKTKNSKFPKNIYLKISYIIRMSKNDVQMKSKPMLTIFEQQTNFWNFLIFPFLESLCFEIPFNFQLCVSKLFIQSKRHIFCYAVKNFENWFTQLWPCLYIVMFSFRSLGVSGNNSSKNRIVQISWINLITFASHVIGMDEL